MCSYSQPTIHVISVINLTSPVFELFKHPVTPSFSLILEMNLDLDLLKINRGESLICLRIIIEIHKRIFPEATKMPTINKCALGDVTRHITSEQLEGNNSDSGFSFLLKGSRTLFIPLYYIHTLQSSLILSSNTRNKILKNSLPQHI